MQNYYFSCSYPLETGSIILPGNWGRIVEIERRIGKVHIITDLRESTFEEVRKKFFSHLPSRMKSIFLCDSLEEINNYLNFGPKYFDLVYKVEIVDKSKPVHKTDYDKYFSLKGSYSPHDVNLIKSRLEELALLYWNPEKIINAECLVESPIRILERLN